MYNNTELFQDNSNSANNEVTEENINNLDSTNIVNQNNTERGFDYLTSVLNYIGKHHKAIFDKIDTPSVGAIPEFKTKTWFNIVYIILFLISITEAGRCIVSGSGNNKTAKNILVLCIRILLMIFILYFAWPIYLIIKIVKFVFYKNAC